MLTSMTRRTALIAAMALAGGACSKEPDEMRTTQTTPATTATRVSAETWIDDVKLWKVSPNGTSDSAAASLNAGDRLKLSMRVDDAPAGTTVTTYWYGPNDRQLAYETKAIDPSQQELTFERDNTEAWPVGDYRAEVWTGGKKVEEESFNIGAG